MSATNTRMTMSVDEKFIRCKTVKEVEGMQPNISKRLIKIQGYRENKNSIDCSGSVRKRTNR